MNSEELRKTENWLSEISSGDDSVITEQTAQLSLKIVKMLYDQDIDVPDMCSGPDGQMGMSWDYDEHHFEIEININEPNHAFYRNRSTNEYWLEEFVDDQIPGNFIREIGKIK